LAENAKKALDMNELIDLNKIIQTAPDPIETFALDVLMGFSSSPKTISPMYFYDDKGSELFEKITDCEDYYPTRCEYEILDTYKSKIAELAGTEDLNLIELGAGDGHKTAVLVEELIKYSPLSYCPIDISRSANEGLIEKFSTKFPNLEISGVVGEYFKALDWIRDNKKGKNLVLFLGSNIGNFSMPEANVFMRTMWNCLNDGDIVLAGFDYKKDIDVMLHAYNDSNGITKEFNLNLLDRMNKELGADFNRDKFAHFATYNVHIGAMESFIVSLEEQEVYVKSLNKKFHFNSFESIHTEYSYKFLESDITSLATETGFKVEKIFNDSKNYFGDAILRVCKQ
jgi:L-histidine Nalpha-methyltransferase